MQPGQVGLRLRVALYALLVLYLLALAATPFAHHEFVCHLKSNTHCSTCHVGTGADPADATPAIGVDFTVTGLRSEPHHRQSTPIVLLPSAGRAPPATSL